MRVLHLPYNIASQIDISVRSLRELGVEARGMVSTKGLIHSSEQLEDVSRAASNARPLSPRWFRDRVGGTAQVVSAIRWADVVHYHYGGAPALPSGRDIRLASLLKRLRLITFWGSDIRIPEVEARDNPYYVRDREQPGSYWQRESLERSRRTQALYAARGFHCVVGGEGMIDYLFPDIFPRHHLVRCGIRLNEFQPAYPDQERRRAVIVHAPSDKGSKGSAVVLAAIETLRSRKLEFEFILVTATARDRSLEIVRSSDIYLDQFVLGSHGMAAVEAMALGKPVVCYIKPSVPYPADLPIVNATPEGLADALEPLLVSGELRRETGLRSRLYAEKYHDAALIARQLVELYTSLLA